MELDSNWVKLWAVVILGIAIFAGVIAAAVNYNGHLKEEQMKACVNNGGQWKLGAGYNYECVK